MASGEQRDEAIKRLEADLRKSQFSTWDAETFLAKRHQAKIEALTKAKAQEQPWRGLWLVAKELSKDLLAILGVYALAFGIAHWLLTGHVLPQNEPCIIEPVPPAIIISREP